MYNSIANGANKLNRLKPTKPREEMLPIFKQLQEIFMGPKADDETNYELANNEAENEQPDTADVSDLESEEPVKQRGKQKAEGLKILTPQQMLSRLPISLAQLETGNNSENFKNEIRQLFYSLYR